MGKAVGILLIIIGLVVALYFGLIIMEILTLYHNLSPNTTVQVIFTVLYPYVIIIIVGIVIMILGIYLIVKKKK